jgi:hypothetical protein
MSHSFESILFNIANVETRLRAHIDEQFLRLEKSCEKIIDSKYLTIHSRNQDSLSNNDNRSSITSQSADSRVTKDIINCNIELIVSKKYLEHADNKMIEMTHLR